MGGEDKGHGLGGCRAGSGGALRVVSRVGAAGQTSDLDLPEGEGDGLQLPRIDDWAAGLTVVEGLLDFDDGSVGELDDVVYRFLAVGSDGDEFEEDRREGFVVEGGGVELGRGCSPFFSEDDWEMLASSDDVAGGVVGDM